MNNILLIVHNLHDHACVMNANFAKRVAKINTGRDGGRIQEKTETRDQRPDYEIRRLDLSDNEDRMNEKLQLGSGMQCRVIKGQIFLQIGCKAH